MNFVPKVVWIVIGVAAVVAGLWFIISAVLRLIATIIVGAKNPLLDYGTWVLILISGVGVAVKGLAILISTRRKS